LYNVRAIETWQRQGGGEVEGIDWWVPVGDKKHRLNDMNALEVGDFIGQGRRMAYCGLLSEALTKANGRVFENGPERFASCADSIVRHLHSSRPLSWYYTAAVSLLLVWSQILMAVLVAHTTPTVGLGCWSGSFLVYGALSSVTWVVQFQKHPARLVQLLCYGVNLIAVSWLVTITVLVVCRFLPTIKLPLLMTRSAYRGL
jgi:hypothetical protein